MTIPDILRQCSVSGVCVAVNGDRLHIDAPKGTITPEMLALLKKHKYQIIEYLSDGNHVDHQTAHEKGDQDDRDDKHDYKKANYLNHLDHLNHVFCQHDNDQHDDLAATMEAYEERCGIMQHDGGLTKAQAEQQARFIHPP